MDQPRRDEETPADDGSLRLQLPSWRYAGTAVGVVVALVVAAVATSVALTGGPAEVRDAGAAATGPAASSSAPAAPSGTPTDLPTDPAPGSATGRPASTYPGVTLSPVPTPTVPALPVCALRSDDLVVVSYNIKSAGFGGGLNLERIAAAIAAMDPDVVLLQEVDRFRYLSQRVDMPAYFAQRLGMEQAFGLNVRRPGNSQYGTAILSRLPITASDNQLLPWRPGTQQRGLLHARIEPHGVPIDLFNTHLEHTSPTMRVAQAGAIQRRLAANPNAMVVGGDFNSGPDSLPMTIVGREVTDSWPGTGLGLGRTVPSGAPRARIDYLLHDGLTPLSADVPVVLASDHRPVRVTYQYSYLQRRGCLPGS